MIKRKSNDNENDNKNGNINKNDQNKTVIEKYGNDKFENLTANISSKNNLKRNHITDANQDDNLIPKMTSTSLNASMLMLNEDTKNEKIKSKFIIPIRTESSSSSLNRTECSLEVIKNISKSDNKNKNKIGKVVKNTNVDQNIIHDNSSNMVSEVVKKSNDVNTDKTDDQKPLTKKGKEKKQKEGDETTSSKSGKKEVTKKVEKVDSKGKSIVEVVEEAKEDLHDDNDGDNCVRNGYCYDNNNDDNRNNYDIIIDNNNRNKNNDKNVDKKEKENQIKNTNKNANKNKGRKKDDIEKEDETKKSDKVDTAIVMQQSTSIPRKNKTAVAATAAVEVEEDSKMTEAMKNVPRKALLTSLLPKESSLEEDVSDDDSLSLGSENENDKMEEAEVEVEEVKKKDREMEVMKEGRAGEKKGDDEQKHLTLNHHQDTDNENNNNHKEEDVNSDDEDDMFFAE